MKFKSFSIDGKKVKTLMIDGFKVKFVEEAVGLFKMTAVVGSPNVSLNKVGAAPDVNLQYSYDNSTWTPYIVGDEVNIPEGGELYWKAIGSNTTFATSASVYNKFYAHNGFIRLDGDLNSLLEEENYEEMSLAGRPNYVFAGLFRDCVGLGMVGDIFTSDVLSPYCYYYMFMGCTQLAEVPSVLPATTLANYCYSSMFSGCSSIEQAPRLPATNLANYCYSGMFSGCSYLTQAPELPATTLVNYCYNGMFQNCTHLTQAPVLPATRLATSCYNSMFRGCTSLTQAPELPATRLATSCYSNMFRYCSSLTQAPELPATSLATSCYNSMFNGCSNLNKIKISYTGDFTTTQFNGWVSGVASRGDLEYDGEDRTQGDSAIPFGWTVNGQEVEFAGLTFKAEEANSSVRLNKNSAAPAVSLMTSTDGVEWTNYTAGNTIMLNNVGDTVRFKAATTNSRFASSSIAYNYFVMTGKIAASGNIMSLLNNSKAIASTFALAYLFKDCTSLTTAPELPATSLAGNCYDNMFYGCTSLTQAPELPATTLAQYCYSSMFYGCTSLTKAPSTLPATTLYKNCYYRMFYLCASLNQAPALPATTLADSCYDGMFYHCSSLTQAPALPATTLAGYCYINMFNGCTSLTQAPDLPATTVAGYCYYGMFAGCTFTKGPKIMGTALDTYSYREMFDTCSNLNEVEVYFTAWSGNNTYKWLNNVSGTGTFRCPQALIDRTTTRGVNTVPAGWTLVSND